MASLHLCITSAFAQFLPSYYTLYAQLQLSRILALYFRAIHLCKVCYQHVGQVNHLGLHLYCYLFLYIWMANNGKGEIQVLVCFFGIVTMLLYGSHTNQNSDELFRVLQISVYTFTLKYISTAPKFVLYTSDFFVQNNFRRIFLIVSFLIELIFVLLFLLHKYSFFWKQS